MAAPTDLLFPYPRTIESVKRFILKPALTHFYAVQFPVPVGLIEWAKGDYTSLKLDYLNSDLYDMVGILCAEASLPGASLLTHEINNDYTGVTERHAYRRSYDDRADFTFYVDTNYDIIKFFQLWISYISNDKLKEEFGGQGFAPGGINLTTYNSRVRFPSDYYTQQMGIQKFEKNAELNNHPDGYKYNGESQASYLGYNFVNAYPISMNSMPVSYESPSLLKCTVSFTYSRYWISEQSSASITANK
jgi:hypothetical protein